MSELWRKLVWLFRRRRHERELDEEMRFHLELRAAEYSEHAARRRFGNTTLWKETSREMWGWTWLERILQDLRFGLRMMRRSPALTAAAVLALAIGIGANTAIFSVVNAVLLRPLAYRDAERLVMVWEWRLRSQEINTVSAANFADWKSRNHVFEDLAYSWDQAYTITGTGDPETVSGYQLSANFLPLLGTPPLLGRTFVPEEGQPGKDRVVVLGFQLWRSKLGADPAILGRVIRLDGQDYTVVGVMPPRFTHPGWSQLWTPLALRDFSERKLHGLRVAARLRAGVTLERAQAEMDAIARQLESEHPETNAGMRVRLVPFQNLYSGDMRTPLLVLQGAVLLVLLIACANVASLLLARAGARQREVAVRLALGASTRRLWRQFLTEALLLTAIGACGGVLLAYWGVAGIAALLPPGVAIFADAEHARQWLDLRVLGFAVAISMAAGLVFGLAPGLRAPAAPGDVLKGDVRGSSEHAGRVRLRGVLVVAQMALSLVLLIGSGLMIRSLAALLDRGLGFRTDRVLTLNLTLPSNRYPKPPEALRFIEQGLASIRAVPGVEAAGAVNNLPLSGSNARRNFTIPGRPPLSYAQQPIAEFRLATPGYFRVMGTRLVRGRYFEEGDRAGSAGVVIINEMLARRFFRDENPIGKTVSVGDGATPATREIVGVVADTRHHGLAVEPVPEIYRPFYQAYWPFLWIAVRTTGDPLQAASAVRDAVHRVDKDQPITGVMSMEQLAARSEASRRTNTALLASFAAVALMLAAMGIYGVMAFSVTRRTREIGIRIALGAGRGDVMRMVLARALAMAAVGVAIGLGSALALTRFMKGLLVDVTATDPITFVSLPLVLGAVAALAAYLPARRAARVNPTEALRYE
jgi:predicted permease